MEHFACALDHRLLHGGFPEQLLASTPQPAFYEDWIDSFYARDILELFGIRNRSGFLSLLQLVCLRNGGQLDISDLAKKTGLSRPTVMSHLDAMEIAHAVIRIPPYHGGGHREIIRQPRIYAFDTGLVAHVQGWESIRESDRGVLWENLVLDETGINSGIFDVNTLPMTESEADSLSLSGTMTVLSGDTITIRYEDPDDSSDSFSSAPIAAYADTDAGQQDTITQGFRHRRLLPGSQVGGCGNGPACLAPYGPSCPGSSGLLGISNHL